MKIREACRYLKGYSTWKCASQQIKEPGPLGRPKNKGWWNRKGLQSLLALLLATAMLFTGCSLPQKEEKKDSATLAAEENVQASFDAFLDELFVEELQDNILNLHYTVAEPEKYGITEYKCSLGDFSEENYLKSEQEAAEELEKLKEFDYDSLTKEQQNTYDLVEELLELNANSTGFYLYDEPLAPTSGVQSQLPVLFAEYIFRCEQDVEDYLEMLSTFGDYFNDLMEYEKKRAEAGLFMSDTSLDTIIEQCNSFCQGGEEHLLLVTFEERLEDFEADAEHKQQWLQTNEKLVKETVIPAYERLAEQLETLRGSGKTDGGLCNLEKGKEYYEFLVRYYTGSDRSIEDMKELISEYEDKDMDEMITLLSNNMSLYNQLEAAEVPQTEPEEILADLQEKIQEDFPEAASDSYQVKKVDKSLETLSSPAFYLTPAIDDIESNVIYINESNGYEGLQLYTTLAHEGYPGHLYQETYYKSGKPHPIRSVLSYGGYTEGWGLYSEAYGYTLADMDEDLAKLNRCNFTATMAMYANMDIGIHYDGWSLTETAAYLKNFGITDGAAIKEVYNYIVAEPSNYLKYFMGYLEIMELREYTKEQLGDDYTDLAFHTFFLEQGPSSFTVLSKRFEEEFGK